jgi:hypothetical protein
LAASEVVGVRTIDLIPGGVTAGVAYVLGYESHWLIETNASCAKQIDRTISSHAVS